MRDHRSATRFFASSVLVGTAGLAVACGPEGKETPQDTLAPSSEAFIATSGAETPLGPTGMLLGALQATVRIVMDEPGRILYTQDGSEPSPDSPATGKGGQVVYMTLNRDTELRWVAEDTAGNREATVHRTMVRFDQTPPDVTVDPEPGGSQFPGPIVVKVRANEPVTIYYRTDGGLAVAGNAQTLEARDTLDLPLAHRTSLSMRAVDAAGNLWGPKMRVYHIDDVAPVTVAEPAGGRFLKPLEVRLFSDDPDGVVHFTLDGSEPGENSPEWMDAQVFSTETTLKFRAVDPGGNWEPTRTETYVIGPIGARTSTPAVDAERVDVAGNLALSAALMNAAGLHSGWAETPLRHGIAYDLWATGRTVSDGLLFASHGGYSPIYAPLNIARAGSASASPDRDQNGSNLEETLNATLLALASAAGDAVPTGIHPLVLPFQGVSALLLRDPGHALRPDGLPVSEDDLGLVTWQGTSGAQRNNTAEAFHAQMAVLAARAASVTTADHARDPGVYGRDVAPVIGQRCVGCHRPGGTTPDLTQPVNVLALVDPGAPAASRLLAILGREAPHPSQPATAAQRAAIASWIEAGGVGPEDAGLVPGLTAREGFSAALAVQQSVWMLDWAGRQLGLDPSTGRLNVLGTNGVRYLPSVVRATDQPGLAGLPRRPQGFTVVDPRYVLGEQARGLLAALALLRVETERAATLVTLGIQRDAANLTARDYARNAAALLTERAFEASDDTWRSSWAPEAGLSDEIDAEGLGDALRGLAAARAADLVPADVFEARVAAARAQLATGLRRDDGWFHAKTSFLTGPTRGERPQLVPHLAVLQGLLAVAAAGDASAGQEARALWGRLEAFWDADTGAWQTSLGDAVYLYDARTAARSVEALDDAARADLPGAEERLAAFFRSVVLGGLLASETWWTGEVADGADDDRDGLLKPEEVPVANGVAPSFRREIRFE
jgi:hypothetical protein